MIFCYQRINGMLEPVKVANEALKDMDGKVRPFYVNVVVLPDNQTALSLKTLSEMYPPPGERNVL